MILAKSYYQRRGNSSPRCADALTSCASLSKAGTDVGQDLCLQNVRKRFSVDPGAATAYLAWVAAEADPDATHTWYDPPAGVPVFWSGGSHGAGHVAIADGHGNCWSTDIDRKGKWDLVPLGEIHAKWGLKYLGWSERLNGVRVFV